MTDLFDALRILVLIIFVVFGNILWFYIKNILSEKGYKVSWYRGHFDNLFDFSHLIDKTVDGKEKRNYQLILRGLISIIVIMIATVGTFIFDLKNIPCNTYNDFITEDISGLVVDKFIDKSNHSNETLTIEKNGERFNDVTLSLRNYGLYDSVRIGDKISKPKGDSVTYIVHADNKTVEFKIDKEKYCRD